MVARLRSRLAREEGQTLIELLTTMAMLSFVMTGVVAVFVSGLHAQTDLNQRFQAQQNARLALTGMRKDVRTACLAPQVYSSSGTLLGAGVYGAKVVLGYGCSGGVASSNVTWCTGSSTGAAPYGLYRQTGTTCAWNTGVNKAGQLTTNNVFALASVSTGQRPELQVSFPVDANLATPSGLYTLTDLVMARNAPVT